MPAYFLDTSALVKLYVREPGSDRMIGLAKADDTDALAVLSLTPVEFRSALRRRERVGDVASADVSRILERFSLHFETRFERVPVNEPLVEAALGLIDRHALRAYDALQLAGCLVWKSSRALGEVSFACADDALVTAANAEGLPSLNPSGQKGRKEKPVN